MSWEESMATCSRWCQLLPAGHEVVMQLFLENMDVNVQGGRYSSMLKVASTHGHEVVVQLLLEKMAGDKA